MSPVNSLSEAKEKEREAVAEGKTLLVALAHPDDEIGCAGTMAVHAALGHRVVLLFLTRGEMTEALGPLSAREVAARRTEHAHEAARILGCEVRLLDFTDTQLEVSAENRYLIAREIAELKPDAVITWGDAWRRGPRHPDHQATGELVRGAVTLARIARVVAPLPPHRAPAPVFTIRETHAWLPAAAIDITTQRPALYALAQFYRERVGWPPQEWLEERIARAAAPWGVAAAEEFDAWESEPGLRATLFGA